MEARFLLERLPTHPTVGGFQVIAEMGRSANADLYLALSPSNGERRARVVVKRLPETDDDDDRASFLDEARLARRLHHPNIAETISVGKDGRAYFIATECLDGQPLWRIRKHDNASMPVSLLRELRIATEVLAGLHYLHEITDDDGQRLDVVHRDVTPRRVFVTYDGDVKITDVASAKASVRGAETQIGFVRGDLMYFAPEMLRGTTVDRRVDVFAVGVILWEAATGRRLWNGYELPEIHRRLIAGSLPIDQPPPDVSEQVLDIIRQALDPNPDRRFATAYAMREAISNYLEGHHEASKQAIAAYLQRAFVEERRRFYQSVRAAESRWERTRPAPAPPPSECVTAPALLPDIDSVTLVRTNPGVPALLTTTILADEGEPPASTPVATSFAEPTWPPPATAREPSRGVGKIALACCGLALLAAGWKLPRSFVGKAADHAAPTTTPALLTAEPSFTATMPGPAPPIVAPTTPANALSSNAPSSSAPSWNGSPSSAPKPPALRPPRKGAAPAPHRSVPLAPAPVVDQFGI